MYLVSAMTFTQLHVFATLAKVGSFSRAAAALGISQSGVSHAIKQLEAAWCVSLFSRDGAAVSLTEVGSRLLVRAQDMLQQQEALLQEAQAAQGVARGRLHIASFGATSSLRLLPQLLTAFRQAHPLVEVHIEEAVDSVVLQWLLERRVELGFVVLPDERFDTVALLEDELVAVLPAAHPLAQKASISALDFHGQPFIRTSAGSGPRVDAFLGEKGSVPNTLYRFEQLSSMMGFVAQGDALTIAARLALPAPPAGVVYRPLAPRNHRHIALAALRFDRLSPAAAAFVESTRKARKRLVME